MMFLKIFLFILIIFVILISIDFIKGLKKLYDFKKEEEEKYEDF